MEPISEKFKDFPGCLRCGGCCYYTINGKLSKIPCRYLDFMPDGTTNCAIYDHRLGTDIGFDNICGYRAQMVLKPVGCPYNEIADANKQAEAISKPLYD